MSRKRNNRPVRQRLLFFVEGQTEKTFFDSLFQEHNISQARTIKVIKGKGKTHFDKVKNKIENDKNLTPSKGTKIFIIFDKDSIDLNVYNSIVKYAKEYSPNGARCKIGFSNISFEIWILGFFQQINTNNRFTQTGLERKISDNLGEPYVKGDAKQMQRIIDNYDVKNAITNTKNISKCSFSNPSTNIGTIINEILG